MGLKIVSEAHHEDHKVMKLNFLDESGSGFSFLMENGEPVITDANRQNYYDCINGLHPELKKSLDEKTEHIFVPAEGICSCGTKIILQNQYMGACECPKCGQWYNLFGQELLPPDQWGEDF